MSDPKKQVGSRRISPLSSHSPSPVRRNNKSNNNNNSNSDNNSSNNNSSSNNSDSNNSNNNNSDGNKNNSNNSINSNNYDSFVSSELSINSHQNGGVGGANGGGVRGGSSQDGEAIVALLKNNPGIIEQYIKDHISKDDLQFLLNVKMADDYQEIMTSHGEAPPPAVKWKNTTSLERENFMSSFVSKVEVMEGPDGEMLEQIVDSCASAVAATGRSLYLVDTNAQFIWRYIPDTNIPVNKNPVKGGTTLSAYVASIRESITLTSDICTDQRFPEGLGLGDHAAVQVHSVLCLPLLLPNGTLTGVVELTRSGRAPPFKESDLQVVNGFLNWGGVVQHYAQMYQVMHKERRLNEFLLNVTKSIFQDIVSMDAVIMKIMNFAQTLVDADRTSLFLVDGKTDELYARIFDSGTGLETTLDREIRFSRSKGVAGHVATTGETLNITDAYNDSRFNREIDVQTGYHTDTMLCMPIFIRGNIIGVVQMVNKKSGVFTKTDEKAFQSFSVYCGLALHHARLYDKIRRSEQKRKIALDVLSYHSRCADAEMKELRELKTRHTMTTMFDYDVNIMNMEAKETAFFAVQFFTDILDLDSGFDVDVLTRFVLTVQKNYRDVPYHNWTHAFTVAHSMYCVIKSSNGVVSGLEAIALYVACLCHDLDHRGRNNDWMRNQSTLLATVYSTSTLEHHHFNQTITILQHDGHNIFAHLNPEEYKAVLGLIKDCILATDLVIYFGNKGKLDGIMAEGKYDTANDEHRRLLYMIAMTACDLSACAKPWKTQYETVKVIFKEFYAQGDEEKARGRTPLPMMDRNTAGQLPSQQSGFLKGIVIPVYVILDKLVQGSSPLLQGATNNLNVWNEMIAQQEKERAVKGEGEGQCIDTLESLVVKDDHQPKQPLSSSEES